MANIKKVPEHILRLMTAVEQKVKALDPTFDFGVAHNPINPLRSVSYFGRQGPHEHSFTAAIYHDLIDRTLPEHLHAMAARCLYVQFLETDIRDENEGDTLKYLMRGQYPAAPSFGVEQHPGRPTNNLVELDTLAEELASFIVTGNIGERSGIGEVPK